MLETTEFSVELGDLMKGTEYNITVWGFNSVGDGSPRNVTEATDIDRELMRAEGGMREGEEERRGGSQMVIRSTKWSRYTLYTKM